MTEEEHKSSDKDYVYSPDDIQDILDPYETWIMRVQSLLVWESPIRSTVFLLLFNFLFWLFAISNYRFFYIFGLCILIVFLTHSWSTKIWPEIRVPVAPEESEGWTHLHPVLLNVGEISHLAARGLTKLHMFHDGFWELRATKPGRCCLYCSTVCILGVGVGLMVPGRLLVYGPAVALLLWPPIKYHSLLTRFYKKFEPFFSQLDNSMNIHRNYHTGRRSAQSSPAAGKPIQEDSDSELDEFIPGEFRSINKLPIPEPESGGSALSSRSVSPFEPDFGDKPVSSVIAAPDLDLVYSPSGRINPDDSSMSLLPPPSIPSLDDVDQSGSWGRFSPTGIPSDKSMGKPSSREFPRDPGYHPQDRVATTRSDDSPIDSENSDSDQNMEDTLSLGLDVPDLNNVPPDDNTTPNYLASVAGQTLTQMGVVGAIGLSRLANYMQGQAPKSTVEIQELETDENYYASEENKDSQSEAKNVESQSKSKKSGQSRMQMSATDADFEFIEHDDLPNFDDMN